MHKTVKHLNDEDLQVLKSIYSNHIPYASHVVSLIDNHFLSKLKKNPNGDFVQFLALDDDWKTGGTFLMKFKNYDLFTFTLSKNEDQIYELLKKTNALEVNRRTVLYGIRNEHLPPVYKALKEATQQMCNSFLVLGSVKHLNDEDLQVLKSIYSNHIPYASHVVSLIDNHFLSKLKKNPNGDFVQFLALDDDWKTGGTFLMKFKNYDLFTFTLSKNEDQIYELLKKTNALEVNRRTVLYGIRNEHLPPVYKALKEKNVKIKEAVECLIYWLPKEKALEYTIECPDEVYISEINPSHSKLIASLWPHTFDGADEYISGLLEMGCGYGIFLKDSDKLVTWILKPHWGTLAILETLPDYKRRGYGRLVTKQLCKRIAEEGINPLCTIVVGNIVSETMFKKMGFQHIDNATFIVF